jgi:hypothetical protein
VIAWHPIIIPLSAALIEAIDIADTVLDLGFAFKELDTQALGSMPGDMAMR